LRLRFGRKKFDLCYQLHAKHYIMDCLKY
jgi:hypothetical protein